VTYSAAAARLLVLLASVGAARAVAVADTPITSVRVATGLAKPVFVTAPPGDTTRVFIVELETGMIKILRDGAILPEPFMTQSGVAISGERGLLGMAFHPQYALNGTFYVHYTSTTFAQSVIRRYTVSADPDVADTTTGVNILTIPPPQFIHVGGWIGFGPDGYLYIAKGDATLADEAQRDTTRFGKILRIDVDGGFPYVIPPTNPFFGSPSPKNEFWAKGLRNPWRCSFDRVTGDLMIGDVGSSEWEELDHQPSTSAGGENYGWPKFEGYEVFQCPTPCDSSGLTRPIAVFGHAPVPPLFCAVTGGYVYGGSAIPDLQGTYFVADYCKGLVWSLRVVNGQATEVMDRTAELEPGGGQVFDLIASFGEDARGEIYICDLGDGEIYKIVPDPTAVPNPEGGTPLSITLDAPVPNPSRDGVLLRIGMSSTRSATLRIYDASGRSVRVLVEGTLPGGTRTLRWDGRDERGVPVSAGLYFLHLRAGDETRTRKLTVVR